ncbi:MAG: cisplatin damage response ATP-dependent DNA ligase, partial [Comamonadaceae bacterium]
DLAETIALLLPPPTEQHDLGLATWVEQHLLPLRKTPPEQLADTLRAQWRQLAPDERLVYFKLITGAFRVGVSKLQVTQALAAVGGIDPKRVAQRLMGYTHIGGQPSSTDYAGLIAPENDSEQNQKTSGQPYPFFLAHPFNEPVERFDALLGPPADWIVEWKWDGIRAQLVKRAGAVWLWSRGEELVTERFPELATMGEALPDGTVLDAEIVVWRDDRVQPFAELQRRIGRKTLGPKLLRDIPVVLLAYDILEWQGNDLRALPQEERRTLMDALITDVQHPQLIASPMLTGEDWGDLSRQREAARTMGVEGMMLKQRRAAYGVGRTKDVGTWWKWKIDPLSIDAVLIYA